jgi:pimeloyl-ACP methyl ester carboxylesterase
MPTININNAEFYYELHGEGQPLVLVSGYTAPGSAWAANLNALAKHFKVLIFDNRASGQTKDDGKTAFTIQDMANDAVALADELNLTQPHYLGWSMGGCIAQTIAANYPDKITKLGLLVTSAKWRHASVLMMGSWLKLFKQNIANDTLRDVNIPGIFGEKFLSNPENIALVKKLDSENRYPQTVVNRGRQFAALQQFDGRELLNKIKAKTLVMCGLEDILSLPYESKYLAENIENAELIEFNCAHMPPVELPHEFDINVINFLSK